MGETERVRILRHAYWTNGYRPLAVWAPGARDRTGQPVKGAGKRPVGDDWRQRALRDPPDAVNASISSLALNTGILTGEIAAVDVDVLDQWLVDSVVHRVEHMLGPTPLVRVGRAPKTLLVYRVSQPLAKLKTPEFILPDGSKAQIEVLGDGQQFVCDGIHPDTSQPYCWTGESPADVPLKDLPIVDEEMLRDMLEEVELVLREAGAVEKEKPQPESAPRQTRSQNGNDFFRNVNSAALADIGRWVRQLFPTAKFQSGSGGWRVSSDDLGRDLEEDLSIHPDGITDFGVEKPQTAIDLVIIYGSASDARAGARWLCEQLGADPTTLGWRNGHDQTAIEYGGPRLIEYSEEAPPVEDEPGQALVEIVDARPPEYSDEALALRFAAKHGGGVAYVADWNRWLLWSAERWMTDSTLRAFDLARVICRVASAEITDPKGAKLAAAVASARTVAAVATLARADRRHAAIVDQWDVDPWMFLTTGEYDCPP